MNSGAVHTPQAAVLQTAAVQQQPPQKVHDGLSCSESPPYSLLCVLTFIFLSGCYCITLGCGLGS